MATEDLPNTDTGPEPPVAYFDHDGTPLAYIDQGTGPVTVVAVPGLPGSTREFRWLVPELIPRSRVIRVDPPGFGHSARPRLIGMTIAQRTEPVEALITALDLAPVVLLGHSAGAQVVAHLSRHHPALVRCCVLLAPPGPAPHYSQRLMRAATRALHLPGSRLVLDPIGRLAFAAQGLPSYLTDDERAHTFLDAAACDFHEYAEDLAHMTHPTLVAWARDDPAIPADRFQAVAALVPPGPRLAFEQGGHLIQETHAGELGNVITDFASGIR
jgi:pimeloyl-ACP methyl ester carboxylesterase